MNSQELRNLQEAYLKVVENQQLDEAKEDSDMSPVVKRQVRNNRIRSDETTTEPELQTSRRVMHTAMRGQKKPEAKSRPTGSGKYGAMNRRGMSTSDKFRKEVLKRGMKEELDLYDIILSHLLDEGYADTEQAAEAIMVNMSEDWRESIVEEVLNERRYDRDEKLPGSGKTPREKSDRKRGQHAARVMLGNPALGRSPRNDPERDSYSDRARMMDRVKNSQDKGEEPKDDEGRKNLIKAARRPRASYERENRPGGLRAGNTKAGGHRTLKRKED